MLKGPMLFIKEKEMYTRKGRRQVWLMITLSSWPFLVGGAILLAVLKVFIPFAIVLMIIGFPMMLLHKLQMHIVADKTGDIRRTWIKEEFR